MENSPQRSHLSRRRPAPHRRATLKTDIEVQKAINYLINPTHNGLWKAQFRWQYDSGVTQLIQESTLRKLKKEAASKDSQEIEYRQRRVEASLDELENIDTVLRLFIRLHKISIGEDIEEYNQLTSEDFRLRHLFINWPILAKRYADALDYFSKRIYHKSFKGYAGERFSGIKSGNFIVLSSPNIEAPKEAGIEIAALGQEPLKDICHFLAMVGKASPATLYTVYSPEEELLNPYIEITRSMLDSADISDEMKRHFDKMIADYDSGNYTACVATAGLIAEECLTQIYETIARKPCPPRQTLGDLSKKIGLISKEVLSPSTKTPVRKIANRREVMAQINKESEEALHKNLNYILEYVDYKNTEILNKLLGQANETTYDYRLYPLTIKMGLDKLISYRNSSLHKSTEIIGNLEALKSVYGSFSLLIWWNEQKRKVKSSLSQKEILELFIESAETYETEKHNV